MALNTFKCNCLTTAHFKGLRDLRYMAKHLCHVSFLDNRTKFRCNCFTSDCVYFIPNKETYDAVWKQATPVHSTNCVLELNIPSRPSLFLLTF